MSGEQKKKGRGRIKRNIPSMTEDVYDMDKIAQGGTASKISSSAVPPKEEVQGLPTKNCNSVAMLPKSDGAQTSEAEVLLGKPYVYKKRESGYGELATNVMASLEKWNASKKATKESTGSMPLTAGSVTDSEVAWLFGNDDDEIVDDGEDSGDDIEIVEVDDEGDLVENDGDGEEDADEDADEEEVGHVEVEQDGDDNDGEVEDNDEEDGGDAEDDDAEEDVEPVEAEEEEADIGEVGEKTDGMVGTDPDAISPGQDFATSRFARPNEGRGTYVPEWVMRICKNGNEMVVLAQLSYWLSRGSNGSIRASKLLEPASDYFWVAESYHKLGSQVGLEWWQVRHAIDHLTDAGFVIKENHLFQNIRTNFFRLDPHAIAQALSTQNEAT
jgi:hypothetical protein